MSTAAASASTSSGTRAPRRDKRRVILDAAAPVFGEVGYERASIDAIASAAGVSKPTVYSHFGSKEQLFRDSVADSARNLNVDALAATQGLDIRPRHWRTSLYQAALKLAACQRSECAASLNRLINAEVLRDPEVFRSVREAAAEPMFDSLAGRLAMLGNAGVLDVPDPVLAANQFFALFQTEWPDLTSLGTVDVSDAAVRKVVHAGVDTFLRAYERIQNAD